VAGETRPEQALRQLQMFETKFARLREERDNMAKAKDALELRDSASAVSDQRILVSVEEMADLTGVWTELGKVWAQIYEHREKQ
jgi:dynein heavy chain 1